MATMSSAGIGDAMTFVDTWFYIEVGITALVFIGLFVGIFAD